MVVTTMGGLFALLYLMPAATLAADTACMIMQEEVFPLEERGSPLDSLTFVVGGSTAKICYSRPSNFGRRVLGTTLPYGQLWRTGAYEPTMLHTTAPLMVAGIRVPPGSFSIYTIPHEGLWQVIINRSISQWGDESEYTAAVQAQELGRVAVPSEMMSRHVDLFTIRAQPASQGNVIVILEWERAQVIIPVSPG